jgi:HlyD family secretion protein
VGDKNYISASGTIEATDINVSAKIGGQIDNILVEEGTTVKVGDTLALIDHKALVIQLMGAEAGVKNAQAQLDLLLNGARTEDIRQAEEGVRQAEVNLKISHDDFQRIVALYDSGSVTQKQKDDAEARLAIAQAQFNSAQEALKKLRQFARPEEIRSAQARLEQAIASRDLLKKNIADCYITAPLDGIITNKALEQGETVGLSATIVTITNQNKVYLTIYITDKELGKVKLGQTAKVRIDTYPQKFFEGKVIYISPQAEFTPKNVQTKQDRVKLVFGVKIEIANPQGILKSGMPADAEISTL